MPSLIAEAGGSGALYYKGETIIRMQAAYDGINIKTDPSIDVSRVVPTAHENRPVSISALAVISY